jgi:hypothetical protein
VVTANPAKGIHGECLSGECQHTCDVDLEPGAGTCDELDDALGELDLGVRELLEGLIALCDFGR